MCFLYLLPSPKEKMNGTPKVFRSLFLCVPYASDPILAVKT